MSTPIHTYDWYMKKCNGTQNEISKKKYVKKGNHSFFCVFWQHTQIPFSKSVCDIVFELMKIEIHEMKIFAFFSCSGNLQGQGKP